MSVKSGNTHDLHSATLTFRLPSRFYRGGHGPRSGTAIPSPASPRLELPGMSEERKKVGMGLWASAGFVIATVALALMLYVASFGLWCRYKNPGGPRQIKASTVVWPYYPMFWLMDNGPAPVKSAVRSYFIWCLS
jgi:hypothetical protein